MLTIALNRGRILQEATPILEKAGLISPGRFAGTRKLVFEPASEDQLRVVVMRGVDVPVYVEHGAADLGIVGRDTLLEHPTHDFFERLDLGIGRCRLMSAGLADADPTPTGPLRVATKFVRSSRRFFEGRGQDLRIIKLSGALEVAPRLGLCDLIVDLVDTGETLRANNLVPVDTIAEITTRVIVNRTALKVKFDRVRACLDRLASHDSTA